jgi:hypothetical protein
MNMYMYMYISSTSILDILHLPVKGHEPEGYVQFTVKGKLVRCIRGNRDRVKKKENQPSLAEGESGKG